MNIVLLILGFHQYYYFIYSRFIIQPYVVRYGRIVRRYKVVKSFWTFVGISTKYSSHEFQGSLIFCYTSHKFDAV